MPNLRSTFLVAFVLFLSSISLGSAIPKHFPPPDSKNALQVRSPLPSPTQDPSNEAGPSTRVRIKNPLLGHSGKECTLTSLQTGDDKIILLNPNRLKSEIFKDKVVIAILDPRDESVYPQVIYKTIGKDLGLDNVQVVVVSAFPFDQVKIVDSPQIEIQKDKCREFMIPVKEVMRTINLSANARKSAEPGRVQFKKQPTLAQDRLTQKHELHYCSVTSMGSTDKILLLSAAYRSSGHFKGKLPVARWGQTEVVPDDGFSLETTTKELGLSIPNTLAHVVFVPSELIKPLARPDDFTVDMYLFLKFRNKLASQVDLFTKPLRRASREAAAKQGQSSK